MISRVLAVTPKAERDECETSTHQQKDVQPLSRCSAQTWFRGYKHPCPRFCLRRRGSVRQLDVDFRDFRLPDIVNSTPRHWRHSLDLFTFEAEHDKQVGFI